MDVVTNPGADHRLHNVESLNFKPQIRCNSLTNYVLCLIVMHYSFKSIRPLDATMLYLSFMFSRGRRSTVPPAFSTRSQPAAMSHKLIPVSMYASNRGLACGTSPRAGSWLK